MVSTQGRLYTVRLFYMKRLELHTTQLSAVEYSHHWYEGLKAGIFE